MSRSDADILDDIATANRGGHQPTSPAAAGGIGLFSRVGQVEQEVTVTLRQCPGDDRALD